MANRSKIPLKIQQKLWILADNSCSVPGCSNQLYDASKNTYVAEIAHIEAYNEGGPRFNKNMTIEEIKLIIWKCL